MTVTNTLLESDIRLKILYLDDAQEWLDNFEEEVLRYNEDNDISKAIIYDNISDSSEALRILPGMYNVFLCDQNLRNDKGLMLWDVILAEEFGSLVKERILFVLYTTFTPELDAECRKRGITLISKDKNFEEVLFEIVKAYKIKFKIYKEDIESLRDLFDKYKLDLLEDLDNINDSSFRFYVGKYFYTAQELRNEIDNRTSLGVQVVSNYIDGLKFLKGYKK